MATEPTYNFPLPKDGYAAFDAISMRNLILQRLDEQGIFTDHNYIGSNLAAIIDVISYTFNTLIYYLNRTSSESTFTEAQLFENISRLTKILDYKPVGFQTSTLTFTCSSDALPAGTYTIPRYSYLRLQNIPFSFNEDVSFTIADPTTITSLTEISNRKLLYQGTYRETPLYIANGDPNETVSIQTASALIDHFNIDVYVYENKSQNWIQYKETTSLFLESANGRKFEKYLNSNSIYEIRFGDGVNGRSLETGDKVVIYYLQSSGSNGIVGPGAAAGGNGFTFFTPTLQQIRADLDTPGSIYLSTASLNTLSFENVVGSTYPRAAETADSIRSNAPAVFKSQYRLVTQQDFVSYIISNFSQFISDVRVFSNWDYMSKYIRYFQNINASATGFQQIILNQVGYADACNFNNIYICALPRVSRGATIKYLLPMQKELIKSSLESIKCLTSEITFVDPIYKAMTFGVKNAQGNVTEENIDSTVLIITRKATAVRSAEVIKAEVVSKFAEFFNPLTSRLGGIFNYNELVNNILTVEGVGGMRTVNLITGVTAQGLSLYLWNPNYQIADQSIIASNASMQDYEYMYFENLSNIGTKIFVE